LMTQRHKMFINIQLKTLKCKYIFYEKQYK
jgi:hypothetical protein